MKKQKGIICHDWEILAFLENRKTRITRPLTKGEYYSRIEPSDDFPDKSVFYAYPDNKTPYQEVCLIPCPFGKIGDKLYIKETFCHFSWDYQTGEELFLYRADEDETMKRIVKDDNLKWRPAAYMPPKASRVFVEIKDVQVMKYKDLEPHHFIEEGIRPASSHGYDMETDKIKWQECDEKWYSRFKKYGENPLVWTIEVKWL